MGVLGTINAQNAFFLGDNYYHKKMVKAFSALKEHKLDKAAGYWRDMEEKAAKDKEIDATQPIKMQLYPVWQLSECMMMNIRDGRGKSKDCLLYDPWSAYLLLKKLYKFLSYCNVTIECISGIEIPILALTKAPLLIAFFS